METKKEVKTKRVMSSRQYAKIGGVRCPACQAANVEGTSVDIEHGAVTVVTGNCLDDAFQQIIGLCAQFQILI